MLGSEADEAVGVSKGGGPIESESEAPLSELESDTLDKPGGPLELVSYPLSCAMDDSSKGATATCRKVSK